jgi:hypothetical protein
MIMLCNLIICNTFFSIMHSTSFDASRALKRRLGPFMAVSLHIHRLGVMILEWIGQSFDRFSYIEFLLRKTFIH